MQRLNSSTNTRAVEEELNILANNYYIPKQMVQLFVKLNNNNYYPIPTYVDSNNNIVIEDVSQAKNKDLFIGTKNQFIYKRYKPLAALSYNFILDDTFKTAWNKKHYIVFRNGYMVSPTLYEVLCPDLDHPTLQKKIVYRMQCNVNDRFDVFYIEHEHNFKQISFNQDAYVKCIRAAGAKVIKIPYPYHNYPKGSNMFYVFSNVSQKYLMSTDYELDSTNTHITVHDDTTINGNFTFVFPYCTPEYELDDYVDCRPNKLLQYDMFDVIPTQASKKTF